MIKPILFNSEMVKAIMDGRKTVTRRDPFKFEMKEGCNPDWSGYSLGEYYTGVIDSGVCLYSRGLHDVWGVRSNVVKPKYSIGDILWVRETWFRHDDWFAYKADNDDGEHYAPWHPSIHMPKDAARIFLRVTGVRVERLEEITEKEVWREGIESECRSCEYYLASECRDCANRFESFDMFSSLWDSTIKPDDISRYGWNANPYVWVIEFERCEKPEGWPV